MIRLTLAKEEINALRERWLSRASAVLARIETTVRRERHSADLHICF